jgi:hypothetical protein
MKLLAARVTHLVPPSHAQHVGDFISPRAYQQLGKTPLWAADNDAYSGFNPSRYRKMLDRIKVGVERGVPMPAFITMPDVVRSHRATLALWYEWCDELSERGLPAAFVLQNGIEYGWDYIGTGYLPWDECDALFIGGDTPFKFSRTVRDIVRVANLHGKWVHMGRVNSIRRMLYAKNIGCDSCDGSGMAKFPSSTLLPMLKALDVESITSTRQLELLQPKEYQDVDCN